MVFSFSAQCPPGRKVNPVVNQRSQRRPPNYLGRSFQRRILVLVGLLGLVLLTMRYVQQPQAWNWLFQGQQRIAEDDRRIDNRLRPVEERERLAGSFIARAEVPPSDGSDGYFPGVNAGYLRDIRDDSPFRAAENRPFFHLMELLGKTDQAELEKAAPERVTYVQLYEQPSAYRGELVTVRGLVRAAWPRRAPSLKIAPAHGMVGGLGTITGMACTTANEYGVENYAEVWLQPLDKKDMVMMLYTLELPDGFPTGENLREEVTATGFFFKRIAYGAVGAFRTTPLLLTKTLRWTPSVDEEAEAQQAARNELPLFLGLAGGMLALCLGMVYLAFRKQRTAASEHPEYVQKLLDRNKDVQDTDFSGIEEHDA